MVNEHSHDSPVGTCITPTEIPREVQPVLKIGEDTSASNPQKPETSGQENIIMIEDLDEEILGWQTSCRG